MGDAIINFLVSEFLINNFPDQNEGYLTKMKSEIVNRKFLNQLAIQIGINTLLQYNKSSIKIKKGQNRDMYGNAFEALIGAIYLDKGFRFTKNYFEKSILNKWIDLEAIMSNDSNYKGLLFEFSQKEDTEVRFEIEESGTKNNPSYHATVFVGDEAMGKGKGSKKKIAEQIASEEACKKLNL